GEVISERVGHAARNVLCLAGAAVGGRDQTPGDLVGQADSVIAANEMETQIDRRGGSGGGQQLAFVDEEDVLVDLDRGEPSGELPRRRPVRGGSPSDEQTRAREDEGAGGD